MTKVEVKFQDLTVDTSVYVGSRALPSVLNAYRNALEVREHRCMPLVSIDQCQTVSGLHRPSPVHPTQRRQSCASLFHRQGIVQKLGIKMAQKRRFQILRGVSGIIKPVSCRQPIYVSPARCMPMQPAHNHAKVKIFTPEDLKSTC